MGVTEASMNHGREDTSQVRLSHDPLKTHASFDDPNLVSRAGLVPVMALAERAAWRAWSAGTSRSPAGPG